MGLVERLVRVMHLDFEVRNLPEVQEGRIWLLVVVLKQDEHCMEVQHYEALVLPLQFQRMETLVLMHEGEDENDQIVVLPVVLDEEVEGIMDEEDDPLIIHDEEDDPLIPEE
jgi:hypothetical protein